MKTTQRLIAAAISALVAGTGMAVAQSGTGSGGAGGPGGASMGGAASGGAVHRETTGQASPQGGAAQPGGSGAQSPGAREGAGTPPGAAEQRSGTGSPEQRGRTSESERGRTGTQDRTRTGQDQRGGTTEQRTGSATSTTGTSVNLTTEQRTRIHQTIIKESNAPRVANVDFSLSVGTTVPRSVRLARVPSTVIKIYPAWRAYEYFMVGDQIVIVDPGTMHIVAVIAA